MDHSWVGCRLVNRKDSQGPLMDMALGTGGAIAGGFLMRSAGLSGYRGGIYTTLIAIIGAVILTLLAGLVNGRRLYARQL